MLSLHRALAPAVLAIAVLWSLNAGWARGGPRRGEIKEALPTALEAGSRNTSSRSGDAAAGSESAAIAVSASDAYPLDVCIVDGRPLGADPVVKDYDGREVRFCSAKCAKEFGNNKEALMRKLDEAIIAAQKPFYPSDACLVSGEKLGSRGRIHDVVYRNRLVRFCCTICVKQFQHYPEKTLAALDRAIVEAQSRDYPLDTCVVTGKKLGEGGMPVNYIYAGQLIKLSGDDCKKEFDKNPAKYVAILAAARKKSELPKTEAWNSIPASASGTAPAPGPGPDTGTEAVRGTSPVSGGVPASSDDGG